MAAKITYKKARTALLADLASRGWAVKPNLKNPTARQGEAVMIFKSQAVHVAHVSRPRSARSMWMDIREASTDQIEAEAHKMAAWSAEHDRVD